jgi:hypothetical protein
MPELIALTLQSSHRKSARVPPMTGRFPPLWTDERNWSPLIANMTVEQAATLKGLAEAAYELDAFKPKLTRAEADQRIAVLTAKLKLLDEPPYSSEVNIPPRREGRSSLPTSAFEDGNLPWPLSCSPAMRREGLRPTWAGR